MDAKFFDSVYEGDSANGVKLGMGITGGDFWPRVAGCRNLYRFDEQVTDRFQRIESVINKDDDSVALSGWVPAGAYIYVLRGVNSCGQEEQSHRAAVRTVFDEEGSLKEPGCNGVFGLKAVRMAGMEILLQWSYSPIGQMDKCRCFEIFADGGTGNVDFTKASGIVDYAGCGYYSYKSNVYGAGRYIFCIRAVSTNGRRSSGCFVRVDTCVPEQRTILPDGIVNMSRL